MKKSPISGSSIKAPPIKGPSRKKPAPKNAASAKRVPPKKATKKQTLKQQAAQIFHYTASGLENVYLRGGYKIDEDGNLFIQNINGLHDAIGRSLIMKSAPLSGPEIRYIRHHLDLSQKTMGRLLGVDYQSVLGWEKEKRPISPPADRLLRAYYYSFLHPQDHKLPDLLRDLSELDAKEAQKKILLEENKNGWAVAA